MALAIEAFIESGTPPSTIHSGVWYVRLKPLDKRAGHVLRDITVSKWRTRVRESKGWHRIQTSNPEMLRDLHDLRQNGNVDDRYLPHAFDICTFEEAKLAEKREREDRMKKREVRADVEHANVLTSSDLGSTRSSRAEDAAAMRKADDDARKAQAEEREARRAQAAAEAEAMTAQEREAEIERLRGEKAAREAELEAMDAEDEALDGDDDVPTEGGATDTDAG